MSRLDKLPLVGRVRRRMRLELAPKAVIRGPAGEPALYRYKDPETGVVYVGTSRWDPHLRPSVMNQLDMDVKTEGET